MATDVVIRPATNADLPGIRELVETCLAEFGMNADYKTSDADLIDLEGSYPDSGGIFLVAIDTAGSIVGTVGLGSVGSSEMKLRKMYVAPRARGIGLGRRLFTAILEEGRTLGPSTIFLETMDAMGAAIKMYEAAGFTQVPGSIQSPRCQRLYRLQLR